MSTVLEKRSRFDLLDSSLQLIFTIEFDSISITYESGDIFYLKSNNINRSIEKYKAPDAPYLIDRINNLWAFSSLQNFDHSNTKVTPAIKLIYNDGKLISNIIEFGSIKFINDNFFLLVTSLLFDPSTHTLNVFSFCEILTNKTLWHFNLDNHLHMLHSTPSIRPSAKGEKTAGDIQGSTMV